MRSIDTSARAAAIRRGLHQSLGPADRFAMAMSLSELAREFAIAGLRERHPGYAEDDLIRELVRRLRNSSIAGK